MLDTWGEFIATGDEDGPYAFALIGAQLANYLGVAIATERGLQQVAAEYDGRAIRFSGYESPRSWRQSQG